MAGHCPLVYVYSGDAFTLFIEVSFIRTNCIRSTKQTKASSEMMRMVEMHL